MRNRIVGLLIVLVGLAVLPAVQAQDQAAAARTQLATAHFYAADLAQRGASISTTRLHLRQVINCMEGPRGKNFAAEVGNPCQRLGNGILVDLQRLADAGSEKAGTAFRYTAAAHGFALRGVASTDVEEAQTYAWMTAFDIDNALGALR